MGAFHYQALQPDGSLVDGRLDAASRPDALRELGRLGLRPLALGEAPAGGTWPSLPRAQADSPPRVKAKAVADFTRQLANLLAAGVPLAPALDLLAREARGPEQRCWQALHAKVVDGYALARAMGEQPTIFPAVSTAMVRAGEAGGFLDLVLRQIAAFQERDRELRSRVGGALLYPMVLAALSVVVVVFLMAFFIPRFESIFADFGAALPPLTNAIVQASVFVREQGLWLVSGAAALWLVTRHYLRTPAGQDAGERLLLALPIVGRLNAQFARTRFCRMLGTLVQSGVPLTQALQVARESLGNRTLSVAVTQAIERVQHGERLGDSLATCPRLFDRATVAMITVAESTGGLAEQFLRLADEAEQDLERQLRAAVTLAEPALLFVMAAVVGLIVIGMVLPIFAIQDYIK